MSDFCLSASVASARSAFPCGLEQPPGAYRFGADALLLGAWAARCLGEAGGVTSVAELGSGCGAALFALLLHPALTRPPSQALGVDDKEALCAAARRNAERLGLDCCHFVQGDVGDSALLRQCGQSAFAAVLANPPYDLPGREATQPLREQALRSSSRPDAETFRQFHNKTDMRQISFAEFAGPIRHNVEKRNSEPDPDEIASVFRKRRHPGAEEFQNLRFRFPAGIPDKAEIQSDGKPRRTVLILKITGIKPAGSNKFHSGSFPFFFGCIS